MLNDSTPRHGLGNPKEARSLTRLERWRINEILAERAEARRLELGISKVRIAALCGVETAAFSQWEKRLPKKPRPQESIWEAALGVPNGWLRDGTVETSSVDLAASTLKWQATASPFRKLSVPERQALGTRAKQRRNELSMSREYVAGKIGTQLGNLVVWERMLPVKRNTAEENWEAVLQVPTGWLRDLGIEADAPPALSELQMLAVDTVAAEIRSIACWVTRGPIRNRTFESAELSVAELRRAEIFALRYGVSGEDNSILQAIGEGFDLTRERIRQISAVMVDRIAGCDFVTPRFDELISAMSQLLPSRVEDLDAKLRTLLGENLSVVSADRFAREILGKAVAVITDRPADMALAWHKVAIHPEDHDAEALRAVRDAARAMIRSAGAAQLYFVAGAAAKTLGRGVDIDKVLQCCRVVSGFEWLIEADGWFWFGLEYGENRLLRIASKVLAIANRSVDGEEIHAALVRSRRDHYDRAPVRPYLIEPTIDVVIEVLRRLPQVLTVQSNNFRLKEVIPLADILSEAELAIFNCLSANGGVASTGRLERLVVEPGLVKHMTLHICLNSTPIAVPIDFGLYALRGYSLSTSSLVAETSARWERQNEALKLSRREDGLYSFEFELTGYMLKTRFFSVPAPLAGILTVGEYTVEGASSPANYVVLDNGTKRFRQLINKVVEAGYSEGQMVRLLVESTNRVLRFERVLIND